MRLLCLMTVVVAMLGLTSAHDSTEGTSTEVTSEDVTSPEDEDQRQAVPSGSSEAKGDGKLFFPFVYSSTLTVYSIQSVTSTIPFTCFNVLTGTATACTGRRRRRRSGRLSSPRSLERPALTNGEPDLLGSLAEDRVDPTQSQSSRLVLTSWITVVSSVTSVSTITKYDTTVSLGMLCTVGGTSFFKTCP